MSQSQRAVVNEQFGLQPLTIVKRGVSNPQRGEAVLELQLSAAPDTQWEDAFDHYPARHTQGASILFNNSRPYVHDEFITWNIPELDVESGWRFVREATDFANEFRARCAS
jgi:hypothetical protein